LSARFSDPELCESIYRLVIGGTSLQGVEQGFLARTTSRVARILEGWFDIYIKSEVEGLVVTGFFINKN